MDPIKSLTTEFHYASIHDEMKSKTDETGQDTRSKRVQRSPYRPALAINPAPESTHRQPESLPHTDLYHPQPRAPCQSSLPDIFDPTQTNGFKALEPYHILPPPPPPPPPPSPTCRDRHKPYNHDATTESSAESGYALGSPFEFSESKYLTKRHHTAPIREPVQVGQEGVTYPKPVLDNDEDFRPDSPWSADSGIEISPPRPIKPRGKKTTINKDRVKHTKRESDPGLGLQVEVETGMETDEGVGWVKEDEKTWKSTFGSPPRSGLISNGKSLQEQQTGVPATQEIYIEVEEWCPGGTGCRHYDPPPPAEDREYGWMPMTPPQEFYGMARDYEQYESGYRVGVALPDDIIEPGTPPRPGANYASRVPIPRAGAFEPSFPPTCQDVHAAPGRYPIESVFHPTFNAAAQTDYPPFAPLPLHLGAPMFLHSPRILPRPLNFAQYLYLKDHYSYSDPMLGRKGAWKCSLCDCGSREPANFVRSGPWENPIEISELGAPENRVMLSRLGFDVDLKKKERLAEKRYVKAQRGRVRSSEKRLNPNYVKLGPRRITPKEDEQTAIGKKVDGSASVPCDTIDINWFGKGKHHTRRQSCQGDIKRRIACYLATEENEDDAENRSVA